MEILNDINNERVRPNVKEYRDVINPVTRILIAKTPLGGKADVDAAAMESFFCDMCG